MKEQLINIKKEELTKYIEALDTAENDREANIYFDYIWEVTRQICNLIGSPNSRKN